jgi:hypothetical protein
MFYAKKKCVIGFDELGWISLMRSEKVNAEANLLIANQPANGRRREYRVSYFGSLTDCVDEFCKQL